MKDERDKRSSGGFSAITIVFFGLALLPVICVLSYPPAMQLYTSDYLSSSHGRFVWASYAPIRWGCEHSTPFGEFIEWYELLFEPKPAPRPPAAPFITPYRQAPYPDS
jgi:hypothetical protein